jgi:multiple sugar transport system substrate-binding protein
MLQTDRISRPSSIARRLGLAGAGFAALMLGTVFGAAADQITVWSGYPEMAPFYQHVADGLKAQYPDLTVSVQAIQLRDHEKRVALGLSSASAADVIELEIGTATRYMQNDLLAHAPADIASFVQDSKNFNSFFAGVGTMNGTVYGVPLFRGQSALFYNTDMFKAAGIAAPPKTMDEFTTDAAKLAQRDASGALKTSGWSLRLSGGGQGIAEKFWINMFQFGGNVAVQQPDGKWKMTLDTPEGVKTLSQYLQVVWGDKADSVEFPADSDAFERGQTAMFMRESWVIGDIAQKAPDLKYATSTLPMGSIVSPVDLFVTGTDQKKLEEAWAFTKAAASPDNQLWMLDHVGWLPNRSGLDFSAILAKTPQMAAFVQLPPDYKFFSLPAISVEDEFMTHIADRLTNAYADSSLYGHPDKIEAVLKQTSDEAADILKQNNLLAQ